MNVLSIKQLLKLPYTLTQISYVGYDVESMEPCGEGQSYCEVECVLSNNLIETTIVNFEDNYDNLDGYINNLSWFDKEYYFSDDIRASDYIDYKLIVLFTVTLFAEIKEAIWEEQLTKTEMEAKKTIYDEWSLQNSSFEERMKKYIVFIQNAMKMEVQLCDDKEMGNKCYVADSITSAIIWRFMEILLLGQKGRKAYCKCCGKVFPVEKPRQILCEECGSDAGRNARLRQRRKTEALKVANEEKKKADL